MDFALIESMLKTNTELFDKAVAGIPPEQWLTTPGDGSNHLTWLAGHIVVTRANIPKLLGREWSAPWEGLFKRGAQRVSPEQYPTAAEIQRAWKEVSHNLSNSLTTITADALKKPAPERAPSLDGTVGGLIAFLCLHESYHVGQASYLRKWLGHGQIVG
jgi:uncharacterized damage-inducible protein DinB